MIVNIMFSGTFILHVFGIIGCLRKMTLNFMLI